MYVITPGKTQEDLERTIYRARCPSCDAVFEFERREAIRPIAIAPSLHIKCPTSDCKVVISESAWKRQ